MDDSNSESDIEITLPHVDAANITSLNQIPEISKEKYITAYKYFIDWQKDQQTNACSENALLSYFGELTKRFKPSTLWSQYSMLKTTLNINNSVDIANYVKLRAFLKQKSDGYRPRKSKMLKSDEINKFIKEAPDQEYLLAKLVLVMGIMGACRRDELYKMKTSNVKDLGSAVLVEIPNRKSKTARRFTLTGNFYDIFKKYVDLRPPHINESCFFLNYHKGKCTFQKVGINKLGNVAKQIATYLKLPNPELYTGHCFRRSSAASVLVDYIEAEDVMTSLDMHDDIAHDKHQSQSQKNFIREFVEIYKSFPAIWQGKAMKNNNNRDAKCVAYEKLIAKLREVEPNADKRAVVRKINSLRSAFRREYRKVKLAKELGRNYTPLLWYYDLIMFIIDEKELAQMGSSDLDLDLDESDSLSTDTTDHVYIKEEIDMFEETKPDLLDLPSVSSSTRPSYMDAGRVYPSTSDQDEFHAFGFNVASKLRSMDKTQRIIAERIIAETLFQGQMGTLTVRDTCLDMLPSLPF